MYVGFFCMWLASSLYVMNPVVWLLSLFAVAVHHLIVRREEAFLARRFGAAWDDYRARVRRYV
jgi:protein-S-isoprenylcysteine O-methyltransferase Ste14